MDKADNLKIILMGLLALLAKEPKSKPIYYLPNGLLIELMNKPDGLHIYISRKNTYPSARELETIMKRWPWDYSCIIPSREQIFRNRFYLFTVIEEIKQ